VISLVCPHFCALIALVCRLPEVLNLFLSSTISLYSIWCIWSLHEALMLGGEAAKKAGFTEVRPAPPRVTAVTQRYLPVRSATSCW